MKLKLIVKNGKAEVQNIKTGEVLQNVIGVDYSENLNGYTEAIIRIKDIPRLLVIDTPKRSKIVIDWSVFQDNTSTAEELLEFAISNESIKTFKKNCWPKECKQEISKLAKLPIKEARNRARKHLYRIGDLPL